MKQRVSAVAALVLGAVIALPASAQNLRPGLWEVTSNIGSPDGELQSAMAEMQKEMADMEPEQRKAMAQMMARQGVQFGGGGMRTKMCVTPEMAKRNDLPVQQQGDCTHSRTPAIGGKMKFSFTCNNPRTRGEGEVSFVGDTSYQTKMKLASGKALSDVMTMDASAKWLGADCGSVKPVAAPKTR